MSIMKLFHSLGRKLTAKTLRDYPYRLKHKGTAQIPDVGEAESTGAQMYQTLVDAGLKPEDMHKFIKSEKDIIKYLNQIEAVNKQRTAQETLASGLGKYFKKEGEVIPFPQSAITDWRKPRPTTGKKGEVIDTSFASGVDKSGKRTTMSNADYSNLKEEYFRRIMTSTDEALNTFLKRGINASDERFKNFTPKQRKDFLEMVDYRLKHGNEKFMNDLTDAKGKFKLPEDLAYGGIAGMLGEPTYQDEEHRVPYKSGKKVWDILNLVRSKFGPKSVTTADKLTRPTKAIETENLSLSFDRLNNKIATQEALAKGSEKMAGPIKNVNQKSVLDPVSTDATTWLQQEKFFDPKALDMYGKKVPSNWTAKEKKAAQKLIDDLGPLNVSPNHPNYETMKAIRQSAKDRLESIKITEALGGNIKMHDWLRMNRKNLKMSDYVKKEGTPVVKDELSGIKKVFVQQKLTPADELRKEFPGISDDLIKNILADTNPQRIAEVKATMKEALKMQEKGMGPDEIINIFKNMKRTKQATGGLAGMLGE